MAEPVLSSRHREILREVLAPYARSFDKVGVFGSRATGSAHDHSDIDLVFYGEVDEAVLDRIATLLDESGLPVSIDLVAYDRIEHPALKRHIDAVAVPLFTAADLRGQVFLPSRP